MIMTIVLLCFVHLADSKTFPPRGRNSSVLFEHTPEPGLPVRLVTIKFDIQKLHLFLAAISIIVLRAWSSEALDVFTRKDILMNSLQSTAFSVVDNGAAA